MIESSTSFILSCTIRLRIYAKHLTWINLWRQTTSLLATVLFLNHSIALLLALALLTNIVKILSIPHLTKHSSYSFAIFFPLWLDIWLNANILLCYVQLGSMICLITHIWFIFWIEVHVLVVKQILWSVVENMFLSLMYILTQYLSMYSEKEI
jgi:hypothetical protein